MAATSRYPRLETPSAERAAFESSVRPLIEYDREDDGRWIAEIPNMPGVMVYGRSQQEAMDRVLALASEVRFSA
jgi:hypothetical protein